jgi:crotonobetainyl-CoA:carnitine CoA-transferase CaiB-like acyl-CoA transferase
LIDQRTGLALSILEDTDLDSPVAPALGADTRAILSELGMSPADIDGLSRRGVI